MSPRPSRFPLRPLALAIPLALGAVAALHGTLVSAAEQMQEQQFDIPAGPLADQLNRFAVQAGIYLAADGALTAGKQSPALQGRYSVDQALGILLGASGLQALPTGERRYQLQPRSEGDGLQLDATRIQGSSYQENAWGPVQGYVATRSGTGTKTDTPLLEIPQTINVITADEIKARGAQSITEALRYTAGMTGGGFSDRVKIFDEPTSRGYLPTPLYLDGLHLPYGGGSTGGALQIEPYSLERIEVMKGPSSVLYGQNQPGGMVNMVSKRPTAEPLHQIQLGTGSYDRKSGAFDLGGPLDDQGQFLYRLTGLASDSNAEIDYVEQQRLFIAPSLTWLASDDTSLTLYAQWQKDDGVPEAQGLPSEGTVFANPNGHISRDRFLGEPGVNDYNRKQNALGYELSHRLDDVWTFRQNARYAYVDDHYTAPLHGYRFVANPVTGANDKRYQTRYGVDWAQKNSVFGVDNIAQAQFDTGEARHTLLIGLDYYHFNSKFDGQYDYNPPIIDLFNPVYGQALRFGNRYKWDNTVTQTGLYLQDQIKLDQWILTLGGRYDWAETDNRAPIQGTHSNVKDEAFTGRAGLTYVFDNGLAPYISYSESFLPQTGTNAASQPFEPSTGKQYETGLKYQPSGQESFIQLSVYELEQENILTTDLANPGFNAQTGAIRSQGVELEGKAALTENLNLLASVSRNDIEYSKDNDGRKGRHPASSPPLTASLWADYRYIGDGPLSGLGAGFGARYVRGSYGDDYEGSFQIPSYTVYGAAVTYDFEHSVLRLKGVKLAVNVENLTDKTYVASCRSIWDCYYGQGRTLVSNLSYDW